MLIVSFIGRMASGKTTNALRLLCKAKPLGISTAFISFADPLKSFVRKELGLTKDGIVAGHPLIMSSITTPTTGTCANINNVVRGFLVNYAQSINDPELIHTTEDIIGNPDIMGKFHDAILNCYSIVMGEYDEKAYLKNVRIVLQTMGSEIGRNFKDTIWVDLAVRRIDQLRESGIDLVVLDDLRFKNEFMTLAEYNRKHEDVEQYTCILKATDALVAERLKVPIEYIRQASNHDSEDFNWIEDDDIKSFNAIEEVAATCGISEEQIIRKYFM